MRKTKPGCKFGEVLSNLMDKRGLSTYALAQRLGLNSNKTPWGYVRCQRFPSVAPVEGKISIVQLAKSLSLDKNEEYELYSALVDTFYPGLSKYMKEIKDEELTEENIKSLVMEKLKGMTWSEIYEEIPEPTVRKIKQLRPDISLLNNRDPLSKYMKFLNLSDKYKAAIVLYFLMKKGAFDRFVNVLRGRQ